MKFLLTRPSRDVTSICDLFRIILRISTHTPLAGRDALSDAVLFDASEFLLTRPSRDVTQYEYTNSVTISISTHTPLAGRDDILVV